MRVMTNPTTFENFAALHVQVQETRIFLRRFGAGPAVLLLHGFPQTHLMWRNVAPLLARRFTVVCADLRGYGQSGCPASTQDHAPYAKRAMARDMVAVMEEHGFRRFSIAGHDRGGRVAYRLALDHPDRVSRLATLDIIPTGDMWRGADMAFGLRAWHWFFLAQPYPLPEKMIGADPDAYYYQNRDAAWLDPAALADYLRAVHDTATVHAMCEDY